VCGDMSSTMSVSLGEQGGKHGAMGEDAPEDVEPRVAPRAKCVGRARSHEHA
jgi:hypothetical protein